MAVSYTHLDVYKRQVLEIICCKIFFESFAEKRSENNWRNCSIILGTVICEMCIRDRYDLDHPKEYVPKSIEVQRACMKEREFYVAFLEKLEKL